MHVVLFACQIGLLNLDNDDFVRKLVENVQSKFQVCTLFLPSLYKFEFLLSEAAPHLAFPTLFSCVSQQLQKEPLSVFILLRLENPTLNIARTC